MFLEKYKPSSTYGMVANRMQAVELERAVSSWKRGMAIILSGPPGSGKSVAIDLAAKKFGLSVISGAFEDLMKASTESSVRTKGRLLVGDLDSEMSASDAEKLAETSLWPLVFVTEDIYQRNLVELRKSSANIISFQKARVSDLAAFLKKVCVAEGMKCDDRQLYELAYRSDGDVRFSLIALESLSSVDAISAQSIERDRTSKLFEKLDMIFRRTGANDDDFEELHAWIIENLSGHYSGQNLEQAYHCAASADRFQRNGLDSHANALMRLLPVSQTALRYSVPTPLMTSEDSNTLIDVAAEAHCSRKKAKSYLPLVRRAKEVK